MKRWGKFWKSVVIFENEGREGQIWPLLKVEFSDPQKCSKKYFAVFWAKQKLLDIKFWVILTIKVHFWMKTDDLRGVRSDPSRPECVAEKKLSENSVKEVSEWKFFKTKKVQNYNLRKVKKFQSNRISHFLTVDFQKMEVRSDPPPPRLGLNWYESTMFTLL